MSFVRLICFAVAALVCGIHSSYALDCNPNASWVLQHGTVTVGDTMIYGPGCGQFQDGGGAGTSLITLTQDTTLTSASCAGTGSRYALGGNAIFQVILPTAASAGNGCTIFFQNVDNWPTGWTNGATGTGGDGKRIVPNAGVYLPYTMLWPTQNLTAISDGTVWWIIPGHTRETIPLNQQFYVAVGGSPTNDCLKPSTACDSQATVYNNAFLYFSFNSGSSTPNVPGMDIRLLSTPSCNLATSVNCHSALHASGLIPGTEGNNAVMVECDAGAGQCGISDSNGNCSIGVFNAAINLEVRNVNIGSAANCGIGSSNGSHVRIEDGVGLGPTTGALLQIDTGGTIVVDNQNTVNINGSAQYMVFGAGAGGYFVGDQATFNLTTNVTFSQQTLSSQNGALISVNPKTTCAAMWVLNGHTATSAHNINAGINGLVATGGCAANVFGTNAPLGTLGIPGYYN